VHFVCTKCVTSNTFLIMQINKNALARYRTLDKCFRNPGKRYFIKDLISEVSGMLYELSDLSNGISRRQVFEDMNFMKSSQGWNAPLESLRDGQRVYYRYSEPDFSIDNQPINEIEQLQLKEALSTLSRFKGLPQFEWISEITARIDSGLRLSTKKTDAIQFDQNTYLKGIELISPIYNAIIYERPISIIYKSFKQQTEQQFLIHPYFLKQYNNRWFVFGLNDIANRIINLALDRIIKISESKKDYMKNESFDFSEYFEDVIGVSISANSTIEHIVIEVRNELIPYIETKPLHGSQKIKERQKEVTLITLDIIPNFELESLILSFGEGLRLLEPSGIKAKIKERINKMKKLY